MALQTAILAVLVLTATAVLLPKLTGALLGFIFRGVGWLIWRRTRSRRDYVIARARSEEKELRASRPPKVPTTSLSRNGAEDEDWEKVDSSGPGVQTATSSESSSNSGNTSSDNWDGIIGFFHPFWYDIRCIHIACSTD
jgi:alpha-1,2-mannosyltransferase